MNRRHFLTMPGALLAPTALAQRGFPGTSYRDYSRCWPDYLRRLAAEAVDRREREIRKLTTPAAVEARRRWARDTFWKLAGGMPERTPLNPRVTGAFDRPGYRVEKLVYETQPGFFVAANLYIPSAGRPPYPGILFQMGHSGNGKAYEFYQRCCQGLVKLGFLVLAFDPMGQGERIYYPGENPARSRLGSADDEHTVPGRQMLLYGDTSTRLQVWDAVRSLDYLASHPLADPKRLGSTGQSGGGTLTMLLACADERLAAAAVASGNTENLACRDFNPPGSTDDAEQNFIDSGPAGFDRWDLLYPMAPKPLLISVSDKDFFGTYSPAYISNGREEFQKLRRVYEVLGHADRIEWTGSPLPHGLAFDARLKIYNWFLRWFQPDARPVEDEAATEPETEKTLWATESGSVVRSLSSETPFSLNRRRQPGRGSEFRELLRAVFPSAARLTVLNRARWRDVDVLAIELEPEPAVWLPAWLYMPRERARKIVVLLEPSSRNVRWHEGELYHALARQGLAVCVPNLRGIDDLRPELMRGAVRYAGTHNDEENYAWASLMLGRPLVGQRTTDVLAVAAALRAYEPLAGLELDLAAAQRLTVPALFAAAVDRGIHSLYLTQGLVSFASVVEHEDYNHPLANFLPGLLRSTDLPAVAASISPPRRLTLAGTVDSRGKPAAPAEVRKFYSAANFRVLDKAGWDSESLLSWI